MLLLWTVFIWALSNPLVYAADEKPQPTETETKPVDIDSLKQRYWNNNETELSVVQNRIYRKSHRLNLQVMGGTVSSDPFLNTTNFGGALLVVLILTNPLGFTSFIGNFLNSNAIDSLHASQKQANANLFSPSTNPPKSLLGGEFAWSILYGKLSLLGKAILHFDLFLLGGIGSMTATNNSPLTPWTANLYNTMVSNESRL